MNDSAKRIEIIEKMANLIPNKTDIKPVTEIIEYAIETKDSSLIEDLLKYTNEKLLNSKRFTRLIKEYDLNNIFKLNLDKFNTPANDISRIKSPEIISAFFSTNDILHNFPDLSNEIKYNKKFVLNILENATPSRFVNTNKAFKEIAEIYYDDRDVKNEIINILNNTQKLHIYVEKFKIDTKDTQEIYELASKNLFFFKFLSEEEKYIYLRDECIGYINEEIDKDLFLPAIKLNTNFGKLYFPGNFKNMYFCDSFGNHCQIKKELKTLSEKFEDDIFNEICERYPKNKIDSFDDLYKMLQERERNEEELNR